MHAVNQIILQEQREGQDPELAMLQVWEVLTCDLDIGEGERSLVLGAYLGRHPPIDLDHRVVGNGIVGEKASARLQGSVDLPEKEFFVGDVMNGVCDIHNVEVFFGNLQL